MAASRIDLASAIACLNKSLLAMLLTLDLYTH
jgi:hypothetical protein